jgi:hypothetical protein
VEHAVTAASALQSVLRRRYRGRKKTEAVSKWLWMMKDASDAVSAPEHARAAYGILLKMNRSNRIDFMTGIG